jgi:hypothetical protein
MSEMDLLNDHGNIADSAWTTTITHPAAAAAYSGAALTSSASAQPAASVDLFGQLGWEANGHSAVSRRRPGPWMSSMPRAWVHEQVVCAICQGRRRIVRTEFGAAVRRRNE